MTRAADDFALIKQHIEDGLQYARQISNAGLTGHENLVYFQKLTDAFNRLFTPRPLRELVAEGYKYAWVWDDDDEEWMMWTHKMPHSTVAWSDLEAIPIPTPQDMGVK